MNASHSSERGNTLIELAIVSVLTAILLGLVTNGMFAVQQTSRANDRALAGQARRHDILEAVRRDVLRTSIDRVSVEDGGRTIRFPMLIGADVAAGEVSGRWSSNVVIQHDANGNVVRRMDGATVLLGIDVETFSAQRIGLDLEVTCRTGGDEAKTHSIRIRPRN